MRIWFATLSLFFSFYPWTALQAQNITVQVPKQTDIATAKYLSIIDEIASKEGVSIEIVFSDDDAYQALVNGEVSLALVYSSFLPMAAEPTRLTYASLISQPGVFRSPEEKFFVQDSAFGDLVAAELGSQHLVLLDFWNQESQVLATHQVVANVADLQGLKIHSTDGNKSKLIAALGAQPVEIASSEVGSAMRAGSIDASFETVSEIDTSDEKLFFKGGTLINGFSFEQGFLLASENTWLEKLSQKERTVIEKAVAEAQQTIRPVIIENASYLPKIANSVGAKFVAFDDTDWEDLSRVSRDRWLAEFSDDAEGKDALEVLDAVQASIKNQKDRGGSVLPRKVEPTILFATNRNDERNPNLEYRFGVKKGNDNPLLCGEIVFKEDGSRNKGELFSGKISLLDNEIVYGAEDCSKLIAERVLESDGKLNIYFHGFNNTFSNAVRNAISFSYDFKLAEPVLVWSWPSAGSASLYVHDINSVELSEDHVMKLAAALSGSGSLEDLTIVAHSMGSRMAAIMLESGHNGAKNIDNLILIAADYPPTLFKKTLRNFGDGADFKTLYANEFDRALKISRRINGEDPIGLGGRYLKIEENVETVDVSDVASAFFFHKSFPWF